MVLSWYHCFSSLKSGYLHNIYFSKNVYNLTFWSWQYLDSWANWRCGPVRGLGWKFDDFQVLGRTEPRVAVSSLVVMVIQTHRLSPHTYHSQTWGTIRTILRLFNIANCHKPQDNSLSSDRSQHRGGDGTEGKYRSRTIIIREVKRGTERDPVRLSYISTQSSSETNKG